MAQKITITCAFCKGTGKNPHFSGTCPVCKGKEKNQIATNYITCSDCRGSGRKRGTSLTCYTCGGLGALPDTREAVKKARKEIKNARKEIVRERSSSHDKRKAGFFLGVEASTRGQSSSRLPTKKKIYQNNAESKTKQTFRSAIVSFCNDCVLGEGKKCWDIECALAPFSPVAERVKR